MNTRMIGFVLGRILLTEAGLLVLPAITAALYGETLWPWIASIILTAACGGALSSRKPEGTALYAKDGKGWLKLYIPARSAVVLKRC